MRTYKTISSHQLTDAEEDALVRLYSYKKNLRPFIDKTVFNSLEGKGLIHNFTSPKLTNLGINLVTQNLNKHGI